MKRKKKTHGGLRKGAGRKPIEQGYKRINIMLDEERIEKASRKGEGNLSLGIRIAIDHL